MTTRTRWVAASFIAVVALGTSTSLAIAQHETGGTTPTPSSAVASTQPSEATGDSPDGGTVVATPAVLDYFDQLRKALSPLLLYVRQLPGTIDALKANGATATASQVREAANWAASFADARDLTGRIPAPSPAPTRTSELMSTACQLYRQSALALVELGTVPAGAAARAVVLRADLLHQLGDRVIDQVRRVLEIDKAGAGAVDMEIRYAAPVPATQLITGQPPLTSQALSATDADLAAARTALARLDADASAEELTAARSVLIGIARRLEVSGDAAQEDVVTARMAVVLALLATEAVEQTAGGPARLSRSAEPLLTLSNLVWGFADVVTSAPRSALTPLGAPELPRSAVWAGGAFNGKPPPLKPGDEVGAGLPGGLPGVDATKILRN